MSLTIKKSEYFFKNPETGKEKDLYEVIEEPDIYIFFDGGRVFAVSFYSNGIYELYEIKGKYVLHQVDGKDITEREGFKDYEQN